MKSSRFCVGLAVLLAALVAMSTAASTGKLKPFKVKGEGFVDEIVFVPFVPSNHTSEGTATQLGKYFLAEAAYQLISDPQPVDPEVDEFGAFLKADFNSATDPVFVAANGDALVLSYGKPSDSDPGVVRLIDLGDGTVFAFWIATFRPVLGQSTGRFEKVTGGSFVMFAISEPFTIELDENGDPISPTDVFYSWEGDGFLEWKK